MAFLARFLVLAARRHSSVPRTREETEAAEESAPLIGPSPLVTPPPRSSRVGLGLNTSLLYGALSPGHFYREPNPSPPPIHHEQGSSPLPELLPSPRQPLAPAAVILPPAATIFAPTPLTTTTIPLLPANPFPTTRWTEVAT
ncbi:hypothetical protein B0H13DRAFT_2361750 [Mycena leptocephala]|nr:hypothetical protein B0H13DRAFT_2361750 [Mycena leptocephala]